ncbi:MAG: IS66 family insertion sequence element accessory protein TnpB [Clostridia bacterium]|nr:IS66 family insertion sequence element accessory protein TnpB [Clostridia bacterium]
MLSEISGFEEIYIACGRSDLRKGIDGLATLVKEKFNLSPFQKNVLFLFCGGRQDRFKGLVWEGDGFVLLYKRIEAGRLRWPRNQEEAAKISLEQYQDLLSGFTILEKSSVREAACTKIQ